MTRTWKWVWMAAGVAIVGASVWALDPRPIAVQTAQATRGALEATVSAEGKTRVKNLFVVAAPVDGEMERIPVKAGDVLSPATVLARIWPAAPKPLDARSRAEAVAAVSAARAEAQRAEAAEREAEGALIHAESARDTARALANSGAAAPKDFEHAEHEVEIRRQALQAARAALEAARANAVRAESAVGEPSGQVGRSATIVRAPTPGRVLRVVRESAGPVAAGTPLVEVGNTAAIEVAADFLTTDAMAIAPDAKATIRDWGGAASLAARVRQIDPGAFTKVSPLGLEEQRVTVVLDVVGQPPPGLGHDFHVNVDVVVWAGASVLTVPSTALFRVGANWAVFAVRGGRARVTSVRAGRSDANRTVIEQGLKPGDEVIVQPSDALTDGSRVTPVGGPS